jgi:hypothetical protein
MARRLGAVNSVVNVAELTDEVAAYVKNETAARIVGFACDTTQP